MKKILLPIAVTMLPFLAIAQIITKDNIKGRAKELYDQAYVSRNILLSDSLAWLAVQEKPNFIDGWILIGDNNYFLKKYAEAAGAYEKAKLLQADYLPDVNFLLGKCYIGAAEYTKAKTCLQAFLQQEKLPAEDKILAEKMVTDCDFAVEAMKHPVSFTPYNLGPNINTPLNEAGPYLTADGKYLYFTRLMEEDPEYQQEDIYYSEKTKAGFTKAVPLGNSINTFEHGEGSACISASGKYLFFSSYDRPDGMGNSDIYISRRVGDEWERANNLGPPINTPGWEGAPSLSADGKTLFFASTRPGGYGQRDIWMSTLNSDGTWGTPVNLGDSINTPFNDESPFIHPDGQTLYFSSEGWPGMGFYDLYMSKKLPDGKWSKAVNLGCPLNTSGYEVSIFVSTDGYTGYYSTERKDGYGQMDIYQFGMPDEDRPQFTSYIHGNVYDHDTRDPLGANVQIYDLESNKIYASVSSDKINGGFLCTLPSGRSYAVDVSKDGYLFFSKNITVGNTREAPPFEVDIPLRKIKVGETIVLNNIFFATDKYDLEPASESELEVLVKLLTKNPTLQVEIGGHTDNTGSEEKNMKLSENRAKSVRDYLVQKGISEARITYKGFGSTKPVATNSTPEGKAQNRRTEMVVKGF